VRGRVERHHLALTAGVIPLSASQLRRRCDLDALPFAATDGLEDLPEPFGQERARSAVDLGIGIRRQGYNLFVLAPAGTGKQTLLRQMIGRRAAAEARAPAWCYVFNFEDPHRPRALRLPAGRGAGLRDDMKRLIEELLATVPATFDSDEYRARVEQINAEFAERSERALADLGSAAAAEGIALLRTPTGFSLAPTRDNEILTAEQFSALTPERQQAIEKSMAGLQERLDQVIREALRSRKKQRERIRELNREVARSSVGLLTEELKQRYADLPDVASHIAALEHDVVENIDDFRRGTEQGQALGADAQPPSFRRYEVNLLLDHGEVEGAPLVFEDNPTHQNLLGRIEHIAQFGALITDFTLIKAGALHRANGGYLLLDAHKLLSQPFAWEGLKRALATRSLRIESLAQLYSIVSTISLEPEPIPLDVKVVLFGERIWYELLYRHDPDFSGLFKVAVDFDDDIERSTENQLLYARLVATIARRQALLPFAQAAVARVIEQRARDCEDAERLSMHMQGLVDLMTEADFAARSANQARVEASHVEEAIHAQIRRADRVSEEVRRSILHGTLLIDTEGAKIGQVNGLATFAVGGQVFAKPTRITASTRVGDGQVIDVQREVKLGGPIHSKGVLILASFLAARFSDKVPHSLRASIVFEQMYSEVEGDSASAAELCALISSLAGVEIRQSIAITGSVNQYGDLQPVGAVNEKIEGFFDLCKARSGGTHGVVIPRANIRNLMLREDVVAASERGEFHVYAVDTVDEAIEILTGVPAGERSGVGGFPAGSLNDAVAERLRQFSAIRQIFALPAVKTRRRRQSESRRE
jgi:lon-related putative ATP-dependent protease